MLTDKQERFAREYVIDANATQAAIRAGYAEPNAGKQGHALLQNPQVLRRVAEITEGIAGELEISAERVIQELARVGFGDLRSVASWNDAGLSIKSSDDLDANTAATVKSVKSTHNVERGGDVRTTMEITQHDKVRALELLGKRFALFTDKVQQSNDGDIRIRMLGLPDKSRGDGSRADDNG